MTWPSAAFIFIASALVAEVTGVIASLVVTLNLEAASLGAIVPTFLLPGIITYIACRFRKSWIRYSHIAYWIYVLLVCVWWGTIALSALEGSRLAFYMVIIFAASAVVAFPVMRSIARIAEA